MGMIILDGVEYGGGGGDTSEEMTLAQYNALTQEQKTDGTVRYITDVNNIPDATGVNF